MGSGSGGWWEWFFFGKMWEKRKGVGRVGVGWGQAKEPASQRKRICQKYPFGKELEGKTQRVETSETQKCSQKIFQKNSPKIEDSTFTGL